MPKFAAISLSMLLALQALMSGMLGLGGVELGRDGHGSGLHGVSACSAHAQSGYWHAHSHGHHAHMHHHHHHDDEAPADDSEVEIDRGWECAREDLHFHACCCPSHHLPHAPTSIVPPARTTSTDVKTLVTARLDVVVPRIDPRWHGASGLSPPVVAKSDADLRALRSIVMQT